MITKVYRDLEMREAAELAMKHRLYVATGVWYLGGLFYRIAKCSLSSWSSVKGIALAFDGDKPVAVAVFEYGQVMAFCKDKYRRKGYASAAVKALDIEYGRVHADEGVAGSVKFWASQGIRIRCYRRH